MREIRYGIRSVYFRTGVKDVLARFVLGQESDTGINQSRSCQNPSRVRSHSGPSRSLFSMTS